MCSSSSANTPRWSNDSKRCCCSPSSEAHLSKPPQRERRFSSPRALPRPGTRNSSEGAKTGAANPAGTLNEIAQCRTIRTSGAPATTATPAILFQRRKSEQRTASPCYLPATGAKPPPSRAKLEPCDVHRARPLGSQWPSLDRDVTRAGSQCLSLQPPRTDPQCGPAIMSMYPERSANPD